MPVGIWLPLGLEGRPDHPIRVGFCVGLQARQEMIDQLRLAGGVDPLPVRLPRPERGADQDAQTATDEDPDEEISASAYRQYREPVHD